MKKGLIIPIAIILLSAVLLSIFYIINRDTNDLTDDKDTTPIQQDQFTLETEYVGNNQWEYSITGYLPNPCYSYKVEEVVMESYPEQVKITLSIIEPMPDVMCIQVIEDLNHSGSFSASEEADIRLEIK
jgi:hypothetical protein